MNVGNEGAGPQPAVAIRGRPKKIRVTVTLTPRHQDTDLIIDADHIRNSSRLGVRPLPRVQVCEQARLSDGFSRSGAGMASGECQQARLYQSQADRKAC